MNEGDFSDVNFQNTIMSKAVIENANMEGTNFKNANFKNAILTGSTFVDANLEGADFTDAAIDQWGVRPLCQNPTMKGTNAKTGASTWESAGCDNQGLAR